MVEVYKRLVQHLPYSVLLSIALIVIAAWVAKELSDYDSYRLVIRNRYFLLAAVTIGMFALLYNFGSWIMHSEISWLLPASDSDLSQDLLDRSRRVKNINNGRINAQVAGLLAANEMILSYSNFDSRSEITLISQGRVTTIGNDERDERISSLLESYGRYIVTEEEEYRSSGVDLTNAILPFEVRRNLDAIAQPS